MEIFIIIRYNLGEDDIMDINELKKELDSFQNRIVDLWRSL